MSGLNQAFVIGANAMIGMAFAAIAYGIRALPTRSQRATTTATRIPAAQPIANPPIASWKVTQPMCHSWPWLLMKAVQIAVGAGRMKRSTCAALTMPSHRPMNATSTKSAGAQSRTRRPSIAPAPTRGIEATGTRATVM